jgi:hypothetical protein
MARERERLKLTLQTGGAGGAPPRTDPACGLRLHEGRLLVDMARPLAPGTAVSVSTVHRPGFGPELADLAGVVCGHYEDLHAQPGAEHRFLVTLAMTLPDGTRAALREAVDAGSVATLRRRPQEPTHLEGLLDTGLWAPPA